MPHDQRTRCALGVLRHLVAITLASALSTVGAQTPMRLQVLAPGFFPVDISDRGSVLGSSPGADGLGHVVVLEGGDAQDHGPGSPLAFNARGTIVGSVYDRERPAASVATIWKRIGPETLRPVGGGSVASAINAHGEVVGSILTAFGSSDERWLIARWYRGDVDFIGQGWASRIDDAGNVVGTYSPNRYEGYAALWHNGSMTVLGSNGSSAAGLNARGQIVGNESVQAHLWDGGTTTNLGVLAGGFISAARDINNRGDVVGMSQQDASTYQRAALWRKTGHGYEHVPLDALLRSSTAEAGWWLIDAFRINASGEVVGLVVNRKSCELGSCKTYGFLLSHSPLGDELPAS